PGPITAPAPGAPRRSTLRDVPAGLPARTPACKRACKVSHRREGSMKRLLSLTLASASALIVAGQVAWAEFPEKDLLGVIMWGAGGATDVVSRAITPHVEPLLGREIVLENKPGATGAISTQYVHAR